MVSKLFTIILVPSFIWRVLVPLRFNYMHYDKKHGAIYKSIEALDHMGMDIIETGDPEAFKKYLQEYDNTICGRHPISVFLHVSSWKHSKTYAYYLCSDLKMRFLFWITDDGLLMFHQMLKHSSTKIKIKFLRYEQSSQCKTMRDSSVSYASAAAKVDAWIEAVWIMAMKKIHWFIIFSIGSALTSNIMHFTWSTLVLKLYGSLPPLHISDSGTCIVNVLFYFLFHIHKDLFSVGLGLGTDLTVGWNWKMSHVWLPKWSHEIDKIDEGFSDEFLSLLMQVKEIWMVDVGFYNLLMPVWKDFLPYPQMFLNLFKPKKTNNTP